MRLPTGEELRAAQERGRQRRKRNLVLNSKSGNFPCGHPKTPENTYTHKGGYASDGYTRMPRKVCRTCHIERARARYKPREQTLRKHGLISGASINETPCLLAETWK